jgi:hypothetical protein
MNIAGVRSIGAAVLLVLLAGAGCNRPKRASSESSAAPTPQAFRGSITAHAPRCPLSHQLPGLPLRQPLLGNLESSDIRNFSHTAHDQPNEIWMELFRLIRSLPSQSPGKSGIMGELCQIIRHLGSGIRNANHSIPVNGCETLRSRLRC